MTRSTPSRTPSAIPRGRPARRPPPTAGQTLLRALAPLRKARPPAAASVTELARAWPQIVGPRLAKLSRPEKLTGRGRDGVLHVRAQGPAAMLIEAESAQILEALDQFCGRQAAGRIALVRAAAKAPAAAPARAGLSPRAARRLDESLERVRDPGLKAALKQLGRGLLSTGAHPQGRRP